MNLRSLLQVIFPSPHSQQQAHRTVPLKEVPTLWLPPTTWAPSHFQTLLLLAGCWLMKTTRLHDPLLRIPWLPPFVGDVLDLSLQPVPNPYAIVLVTQTILGKERSRALVLIA